MRFLAPTAFPITLRDIAAAGWGAPRQDAVQVVQDAFAVRLGVDQVYPVASGRTALALLLRTLAPWPSGPRNEVILPAYTCPSLIRVILDAGLTPCLVDLDPVRMTPDPEQMDRALGARTLAVIFVHPFGLALDVAPWLASAHAAGAILIEDAAQALGAIYAGKPAGTQGDFGIFSTGPGKPLAVGGGGLLTVNEAAAQGPQAGALAELERAWSVLRVGGALYAGWSLAKLALVGVVFHPRGWWLAARAGITRAGDSETGQSYAMRRMTAGQARAALRLLPTWERVNQLRRRHAYAIMQAIPESALLTWPGLHVDTQDSGSIYLRLPLLAQDETARDALVNQLQNAGIGAGKMYRTTLARRFPELGAATDQFPGAEMLAQRLLTLPTHHHVTEADRMQIVTQLRQTEPPNLSES